MPIDTLLWRCFRSRPSVGDCSPARPPAGPSSARSQELGEQLDTGQAGLVVVAVADMGAKVERAMERAAKVQQKQIEADLAELERDAASKR